MEIDNDNINKFLAIMLFIVGLVMFGSGIYVWKQITYCNALVNEYNETVKVTRWKQLKIQTS